MKISVINYEIKTIIITNRNQNLHIILSEHVTVLPTVKVQSNPIPENGDTTNFNVQSFTGKQDRVIGDVITKLRGIEVDESSGVIKYNDKSISHYYIDGLDLLEKKYNIANKNIPADMVDQVQVLNNHQGILLFDSLKNSGEPALNIKLKKKYRTDL